jgi:hypothetical protein
MTNICSQTDKNPSKTIAGVDADVFASLPKDDQAFLKLIDGIGYTLDSIHTRMLVKKGAQ